jgi:hypothetical protein
MSSDKQTTHSVKMSSCAYRTLAEFGERFGLTQQRLLDMAVKEFAEHHANGKSIEVDAIDVKHKTA